jgi:hypothetical protein
VTVSSLTRDPYALFDCGVLDIPFFTDPQKSRAQAEIMRSLFDDVAARRAVSTEWRSTTGCPTAVAALHWRYADLIVVGQLDAHDAQADLLRARPEEVAMLAGRPVWCCPMRGISIGLETAC